VIRPTLQATTGEEPVASGRRVTEGEFRWTPVPSLTGAVLAASFGAGLSLLTLFFDRPRWDSAALQFVHTPQFLTYVAVLSAEVASSAVVAVVVIRTLRGVWKYRVSEKRHVLIPFSLLVALTTGALVFAHARQPDYPFPHGQFKEYFLTVPLVAVALLAAVAMRLVQTAVERTFPTIGTPTAEQVARFVALRTRLQLLLTCLGVVLGGAILAAGAFRNAILADNPRATFPAEWVLMYGATVSGLVALAYWPTHARVVTLGCEMRDRCLPIPPPPSATWAAWHADRKALEELLGLQASTTTSLRTGAAILTPLAGSIVGVLLGTH
jgi:Flp pilus assembly pilin Flp